jgi:aryl-alcohol dehydrogenase-like predicted oxidoreductase
MPTRILGASGMRVSQLCLGTMMFGDQTDEATATRIADHAFESGVNFIDTADQYAKGLSEEITGRAIKANRNRWIIATKCGNPTSSGPNDQGQSRAHVVQAVETSLKRLGTDRIDLYYVHFHDPMVRWENVVETYGGLIRQGKICEWGVSNLRGWHVAHVCHIADRLGVARPVALQPYYNLMNRQPEVELLPAAREFGLGVVPGTRAARADRRMMETEWRPESLAMAEKLKAHAAARGVSLIHWAVAWVLNNRAVASSIVGPRTFEQWSDYKGALAYQWTAEDEALANASVPPGHASTPGFTDPRFPVEGRYARVG